MTQTLATDEAAIRALYKSLHDSWNKGDAGAFAACFTEDGLAIGFDGSQHNGRAGLESDLGRIFVDHNVASYVAIVRSVRFLAPDVAFLHAVVGMVPPGAIDIKPEVNAIQCVVTVRQQEIWRIALLQNTPTAFHGRPQLAEQLTEELREARRAG